MTKDDALSALARVLAPLTTDKFFTDHFSCAVASVEGDRTHPRASLLGADPRATILSAWRTHASSFGTHGDLVTGAPPARDAIDSPTSFATLLERYQALGYTVHIPDVASLSVDLRRLLTAIEILTQQPASAAVFWSKPGNKVPVHFDYRDNIVIQIFGEKRWFISNQCPSLHNPWPGIGVPPVELGSFDVKDVAPGHLLFIPRGVPHTVETKEESLHISITLSPITMRESIIAALDFLSEFDRALREPTPWQIGRSDSAEAEVQHKIFHNLAKLTEQCKSKAFIGAALRRRASRFVGDLPPLTPSPLPESWRDDTVLLHTERAVANIFTAPDLIDFAVPGKHLALHRGASAALQFIVDNGRFTLGQIPDLDFEVKVALASRLLDNGYLMVDR